MPRLLPGRRASTAGGTVLKKQHVPRPQLPPPPEKDVLHKLAVSSVPPVAHAKPTAANVVKMLGNEAARKQVETVLAKIEAALPYPTGATLNAVDTDESLQQTKLMLIKLSREFTDLVMVQIFELVEKLELKTHQPNCPLANLLDSQLYLLKMAIQALNSRWPSAPALNTDPSTNAHRAPSPRASDASLRSNATASSWIEPPALEERTVDYMLHVLHPYLMSADSHDDPEPFPWTVPEWEPSLVLPDRVSASKPHDPPNQNIHSPNGTKNPIVDAAREAWVHLIVYTQDEAEDEALHGSFFASVPILIKKYAIRVVYHLSASNWSVIFERFKARIHAAIEENDRARAPSPQNLYLPVSRGRVDAKKSSWSILPEAVQASRSSSTLSQEDNMEYNGNANANGHSGAQQTIDLDLKLLAFCLLDKTRLLSVLQEIISTFRDIPASLQDHAGVALRQAIINWVEGFPQEFAELWTAHEYALQGGMASPTVSVRSGRSGLSLRGRMLEGTPERLFDMLFSFAKEVPKRAHALYPMLAVLLSISPEKMDTCYQILEGFANPSRANNFLTILEYTLQSRSSESAMASSAVKTTEQASYAYLDLLRLSFILRNHRVDDNHSLEAMGANLAQSLKSYLLNLNGSRSPFYTSRDPIDVNFYVYAIVAIFRFDSERAVAELLMPCLDAQRSLAVKLVAVKALILLVVDAYTYPLQPRLDFLYPLLTDRLGGIVAALAFKVPEMVNGVPQPASPFPYCKSLAAEKYNDTRNHMETVRLTTYFCTLFCYDTRFIMYGVKENENEGLRKLIRMNVSNKRDPKERVASILTVGLCFLQSFHAIPGTIAYQNLIDHVRYSADFMMEVSAELLMEYSENPEMARLSVRVILLILQEFYNGSEKIDSDVSWRFTPQFMAAYQHVEVALLSTLYCSDMAIIRPLLECLCILAKLLRHPAAAAFLPGYATSSEYQKRYLSFEAIGASSVHATIGQAATQKHTRRYLQISTVPTPGRSIILRFYVEKFFNLLRTIQIALARQQANPNSQEGNSISWQVLTEWRNILFIVTSCIRIDVERMSEENLSELKIPNLPLPGEGSALNVITSFLQTVLGLIDVDHAKVRDAARDALGVELNFKALEKMLEIFDKELQTRLKGNHSQRTPLFVEQALFILKTLFERLDGSLTMFENNAPSNLVSIGRYISTLPSVDVKIQRLRHLYCNTIITLLQKRDSMAIRDENEFRHDTCTLATKWLMDKMPEGDDELRRQASETKLVTLKLFVLSAEYLHLPTRELLQRGELREANIYIDTLMRILPPDTVGEVPNGVSNFDKRSGVSEMVFAKEALIHDLVVSGIAHVLNNNSEKAKDICLAKISDPNLRIRVVFMKVFTRILNQGVKFNPPSVSPVEKTDVLCKLVRDTSALSVSITAVCPPGRVEYVTPILLRIFDTPDSLVTFLKTIIDVELASTADANELLRSTNARTRFTSLFAQKHGYHYLRTVVKKLLSLLTRYPPAQAFDIDSSSGGDLQGNVSRLKSVTQEFIQVLVQSTSQVPLIIREICHYMANAVSLVWPDSKYPALGAFVFLRFLGPAIVAPDTVNLVVPDDRPHLRRALVNVARLVQVISNRNLMVRERLPQSLVPFVQKNTSNIHKYLTLIQNCDSSFDETGTDVYPPFNEADGLGLRKYIDLYSDSISRALIEPAGAGNVSSGKEIWDSVAACLLESRVAIEPPKRPSLASREHKLYRQFCDRYRDHNLEAYEDIFKLHQTGQGPVLVIYFANIIAEIVDFDLLLFAILKTITGGNRGSKFDVIFDFTGFTLRSRLPIPWLKRAIELIPTDIQQNWRSAYIFNTNVLSQGYLRQVLCVFKDFELAKLHTSSLDDLRDLFPTITLLDEFKPNEDLFEHVHFRIEGYGWRIGTVQVGENYARISSSKPESLSPFTLTHLVELVNFHSVENIHRDDSSVVLRHYHGPSIILEYSHPEELWKALIEAKKGAAVKNTAPFLPASETSDTNAVLFAVGLIHACHHFEFVRNAAYELLTANCAYLGYPFDEYVPWRGSYIPSNTVAFISAFSDGLSRFAPHLTLDFVLEWCRGFQSFPGLSIPQKLDCLHYLRPWIPKLDADLGSPHFNEDKLRNCIYLLVDITLDDKEVFPEIQRTVWMKIGQLRAFVMDIAIQKLTRIAIDFGLGTRQCDQAAETLMCLSSIHIQPTIIADLKEALSAACNKEERDIMANDEWRAIGALTRLALVSGHSLKLVHTNQLCAGDIAYLVSMLAGIGTLLMRQSVWGMAVNLIQALLRCRSDDDFASLSLRRLYDELHDRSTLKLFGLDRPYLSAEIVSTHSISQHIPLDSIQKIVDLLTRILETGSQSIGCSNVWKARWTSLISSISFRRSEFSQRRGLAVLGSLTNAKVDEGAFRQLLLACRKALSQADYDDNAFLGILFCIRKSIPGLLTKSNLLGLTFWLAVSLLQAGPSPHYGELLRLIEAVVDTMDKRGYFQYPRTLVSALMQARQPIRDLAAAIDKLSGLSFETDFGFSLVMTLWNGVKNASDGEQLRETLLALLKHSVHHANPESEARPHLDELSIRFFIGLTPCFDRASFCNVLKEECHVAGVVGTTRAATKEAHDSEDYEYGVKADMLPFEDFATTILATDIVMVLETHPILDVLCRENAMLMLEVFAGNYPDQHAQGTWFIASLAKEGYVSAQLDRFFGMTCKAHAKAFGFCLNNSITRAPSMSPLTTDATPNISSTSLAIASNVYLSTPAEHGEFLVDLGMGGAFDILKRAQRPDSEAVATARRDILNVARRLIDVIINIT